MFGNKDLLTLHASQRRRYKNTNPFIELTILYDTTLSLEINLISIEQAHRQRSSILGYSASLHFN